MTYTPLGVPDYHARELPDAPPAYQAYGENRKDIGADPPCARYSNMAFEQCDFVGLISFKRIRQYATASTRLMRLRLIRPTGGSSKQLRADFIQRPRLNKLEGNP